MMETPNNFDAMVQMLSGRALDEIDGPHSLLEALGKISITLHGLHAELAKPEEKQDAEILFELLVVLSTVAMLAAAEHVLPALQEEVRA
jgi:hypothetical protein